MQPLYLPGAASSGLTGAPHPTGGTVTPPRRHSGEHHLVATKIRLKRLGKIRQPYYRIVVADSRTKRDGRVIEEIGKYHPTEEPSLIEITSERAQYWLGVGAQPTEQVLALLKVTGDWQKFKGLPGAEGTLRTKAAKADPKAAVEAAAADAEKVKATASEKKAAAATETADEAAPAEDEQA
ncbi:small subunit ribosomal protein S16 [Cellulomonas iranensis]|uniref:Small ribosomal subunit protein bS16 n=1 Tax=Cellulomonas iranensis TaxID=76862 RepID=A0ABU0GES1_9CELL|nr:small subunit ribosomal protein S16 [Cellulomonas iranensis]